MLRTGWILWVGGALAAGGDAPSTGAIYDLAGGEWASMPFENAPGPRAEGVAVWAGHPLDRMVIFGGRDEAGAPLADGGIFIPSGAN